MVNKTDTRQNLSIGVRLRMFIRFLGITALLAAGAGAIYLSSVLADWRPETLQRALKNEINSMAFIGSIMLFGGAILAVFALLLEVLAHLTGGTGGRGAVGVNALVQVVLASALVVAINVYTFLHPASVDLTSRKLFTLPESATSELQQLNSETTIVVLQRHKTLGRLSDQPDRYDYAAERKVVEKVLDTVAQFQELGPRFKVVVLDVEEESYKRKLDEVTKDKPALRDVLSTAPENSIVFFSDGKVQRLSFHEFYQLDKQASLEVEGKTKGNLKLQPQNLETLITRITAIEEKRPRVAVLVTHPLLMTQKRSGSGAEDYTLSGLKKSLNQYGIDVVDAVLKKNYRGEFDGDPATLTSEESQIIKLEEKLENARQILKTEKGWGERLTRNLKKIEAAQAKPLKDRIETYLDAFGDMRRQRLTLRPEERNDPEVQEQIQQHITRQFNIWWKEHLQDMLDAEQDLKRVEDELAELRKSERSIEDRYLTDHKAKLQRMLADCDMLIIPRMTIMNATTPAVLPRNLHKLDKAQIDVIKDFMKAGKPVLVCAGPINTPNDGVPEADELEAILGERGMELAKQTVLFNVEIDSYKGSAQQGEDELEDRSVEVPPVRFAPPEDFKPGKLKPNPIVLALAVLNASVEQPLQIHLRAPRPVRVTPSQEAAQGFEGSFLWTHPRSWAENYPFDIMFRMQPNPFTMRPERVATPKPRPRFDLPSDDARKAGPEAENEYKGTISIAASVEGRLPESWYTDKEKDLERKSSRLVVIGHGSVFNKPELTPATERLLLVVSNWLLKREDRLPHKADPQAPVAANRPWEYPRVNMEDGTKQMWRWGAFLGLPGLCVYLGLIVLMVRKVR